MSLHSGITFAHAHARVPVRQGQFVLNSSADYIVSYYVREMCEHVAYVGVHVLCVSLLTHVYLCAECVRVWCVRRTWGCVWCGAQVCALVLW